MILRYDGTTKIAEVTGVGEGSINSAKLADNSVTTTKVVDGSITTAKLASGAVTSDKIDWTTIKGSTSIPIAIKNATMIWLVPCTLARVGNLVLLQINGSCTGTPDKEGTSIETLPVGFRPALEVNSAGYISASGGDTAILGATIRTNGTMAWWAAKTPAKNAYLRCAITYPTTDDWPS